jgi:hypothetical protein
MLAVKAQFSCWLNSVLEKEKGLINSVSCINMNTAVFKWVTLEFLCYRSEVVKILIASPPPNHLFWLGDGN